MALNLPRMLSKPLLALPAHPGAILLVGFTALGGAVACLVGAWAWGVFGVALGLVSAWVLFLLGLVALYLRDAEPASPVDVENSVPLIVTPSGAIQRESTSAE